MDAAAQAAAAQADSAEALAEPADGVASERPYQTLFMEAPEAYVVTSADGTVIDLNRHAERLYKTRRGRLIGRHVTELADMDREEYARRDAAMQVDGQATFMGLGRRTDGSAFAQQITIRRVVVEGEARNLVHIRDTTEPDRLQAELLQAQKMEALGQLVAGAAHELNNPLQAIIGFSRLLSADPALPAELREDAALLVVEATRTRHIVENLLDFARQRPPERYPTKLGLLVQSVLDLQSYHLSGQIGVEVDIPDDLPLVPLDRAMMQQVILNLTQNAIQAIRSAKDEGTIRIAASGGFTDSGAEVVRLTVADNGPGVGDEYRDSLFLPFFTTKPPGEGTGLGLSVSFGIVAGHGGRLWFEPAWAGGSVFTIELPLEPSSEGSRLAPTGPGPTVVATHDGPAGSSGTPWAAAALPGTADGDERRLRILVLDDEAPIRTFLLRVLRRSVDVVAAATGSEALRLIEEDQFDGVLCDHRMPGMSGTDVYEQVATLRPELARHFILMSGDVLNPELLAFARKRSVRLLSKPFEIETLQGLVDEMRTEIVSSEP
jgi:PAS domain S-box-containing protein